VAGELKVYWNVVVEAKEIEGRAGSPFQILSGIIYF
jgi:hypothetical protein